MKHEHVPWSLRVATVSGIPIRLHATLLLLFGWIYLTAAPNGHPLVRVGMTAAIFFCVILHELGHSLVAQRLGIQVNQITLYPIGGIAQLASQPDPKKEIWITIAGPLVNLVIGFALLPFASNDFLHTLGMANFALFCFNLLPAFPMDGGRLLRAFLGLKLEIGRATRLAARIGQGMAILLGLVALRFTPWLLVTAFFLYNSAGMEVQQTQLQDETEHLPVRQAMMTELRHLVPGDTLLDAGHALIQTAQKEFPVLLGDTVVGVLTRDLLVQGMSLHGRDAYVSEAMAREFPIAAPDDNLWELASGALTEPPQVVVVQDATGKFLGLVTPENLTEALLLERIAQRGR